MAFAHNPVPADPNQGEEEEEGRKNVYSSWLPMSADGLVPQSALTICSTNLTHSVLFLPWKAGSVADMGCNIAVERKAMEYMKAWERPAPPHCRSDGDRGPEKPELIHSDRLGFIPKCSPVNR